MPWKENTIMSQKEAFVKRVEEGFTSFSSLCAEFGISRPTGYSILKKYECEGLTGLIAVSKAPHTSPQKIELKIEKKILSIRSKYNWGAKKIYAYLKKQNNILLPGISTISNVLKRNGCITEEASLKTKKLIRFERENPNDLWQMDFKGQFQLGIKQSCYPLTILDDYSRFLICLQGCKDEAILAVKKQLIIAFKQFGLPKQINVDNGRPWGNSSLVKHTALTVWLLHLDVKVTHSRPRHPQTNGKLERLHRTLKEDLLQKQSLSTFEHAQRAFNQWRKMYNYERPHEGIGMLVPADRYKACSRAREMPTVIHPVEYEHQAIVKKVSAQGIIHFKGKTYIVGKAFSGYYLELKPDEINAELGIYFGRHKIQKSDLV